MPTVGKKRYAIFCARFSKLRSPGLLRAVMTPCGRNGFSLVEVAITLGIVSFAFVPLLGIIPQGMGAFRGAVDTSVTAQIMQRVVNELQQADFDQIITVNGTTIACGQTGRKDVRYFDDQGNELLLAQQSKAIYCVNTRVAPNTQLPAGAQRADNAHIATVTIQIAKNPSGAALATSNNLWTETGGVSVATFPTMVARNHVQ
jgi:uncharacterized protein (TIGR02598 family)